METTETHTPQFPQGDKNNESTRARFNRMTPFEKFDETLNKYGHTGPATARLIGATIVEGGRWLAARVAKLSTRLHRSSQPPVRR